MPNYYNSFASAYNPYAAQSGFAPYPQSYAIQTPQNNQYMINVDGEMAARAWQMPSSVPPNSVIPLYDLDGEHVYFKSVDAYGRMNPLRKGRIIFDDEIQKLPQEQASGAAQQNIDMSGYVTKADFDSLKQELRSLIERNAPQNQNGSKNGNRGDGR